MKKIFALILSVLMFTNAFAEAVNIKPKTLKKDKEVLMSVLEKGQCGSICIRYERKINGMGFATSAFGFCRASVTICKE